MTRLLRTVDNVALLLALGGVAGMVALGAGALVAAVVRAVMRGCAIA